jgi:hypothetical protein
MSKTTYRGSCHCGKVRFEVDLDLSAGTGKCNCSICHKTRWWSAIVKPEAFRLQSGEDQLADYQWAAMINHGRFCRSCGVRTHGQGNLEVIGGPYVSVSIACLDDVDPAILAAAPVRYMNGRDNDWLQVPAVTAHL